jgi:hypothetical protein
MKEGKKCLQRRCPRLGGPVSFDYCWTCGDAKQPCWKIVDCWWETFDIVNYLKKNLSEEEFNRLIHAKPKPKITSLVELIEQAKQHKKL